MKTRWTCVVAALLVAACGDDGGHANHAVCGDGVKEGTEQCDDGNTASGDGCSSTCTTEQAGQDVCGDGIKTVSEACDDGNTVDGDGCSSTCMTEQSGGTCASPYDLTLTANGADLEGMGMGDTSTGSTNQVAAADCDGDMSGAGNDHVWKFTLTDTRDVYILVDDTSNFDTVLRLQTAPCDTATEVPEYTGADGCANGMGASEFLGYVALPAGTYYIVIDGYAATDSGTYKFNFLATASTCGDGVLDPLEFCDDGAASTTPDGCNASCEVDAGYTCDFSSPSVCTVDSQSTAPAAGELVINEFMSADNTADTNCDGKTTGTDDEFIEIVNVTNHAINLDGVTIADSVVVRHTFGALTLPAGEAVVVWNNGTPMCTGVTNFDVASSGQLGFNDTGDTITVALGTLVLDDVTYGQSTVRVSWNRSTEDDPSSTFVLHNTITGHLGDYTPGFRVDGSTYP